MPTCVWLMPWPNVHYFPGKTEQAHRSSYRYLEERNAYTDHAHDFRPQGIGVQERD